MEYRTLGKTGLRVSAIGFGGAPIGIPHYLSPEDRDSAEFQATAVAAIEEAVARGINYFDTAPGYGEGRSERLFGRALQPHRAQIILATKVPFQEGKPFAAVTEDLQASLERLQTGTVDVLQLHGGVFDDAQADRILASSVLDWMEAMRGQGLCRFTGITAEGPSGALEHLLRTGRFDVLEIAYNLIYQSTCDYQRAPTGIIPLAKSLGMGVTTMRPTTCGFLQRLLTTVFPDLDSDAVTRLAIRFVLSTPEVDCAVVGMRNVQEVAANVELVRDTANRFDLKALHNRFV